MKTTDIEIIRLNALTALKANHSQTACKPSDIVEICHGYTEAAEIARDATEALFEVMMGHGITNAEAMKVLNGIKARLEGLSHGKRDYGGYVPAGSVFSANEAIANTAMEVGFYEATGRRHLGGYQPTGTSTNPTQAPEKD